MNHDRSEDRWSTNRIKFIKSRLSRYSRKKTALSGGKDKKKCCSIVVDDGGGGGFQVELREQQRPNNYDPKFDMVDSALETKTAATLKL